MAARKGREKRNLQLRERKGSVGKEFSESEQRLKRWGRERISKSTLGVRKPGKGSCIFVLIFVGLSSLWWVSWCIFVFLVLPCAWWFVAPMTKLDGKIVMWTHDFYGMNLVSELLFCFLSVSITMNWFDV